MEYRIKQGDELICGYTGKPAKVLIQLIDTENKTSAWLSREALLNADKLLCALEGVQPTLQQGTLIHTPFVQQIIPNHGLTIPNPVQLPFQVTCSTQETMIEPVVENQKKNSINANASAKDNQLLKSFEQACRDLQEDPPPDKNGNQSGVPGFAVRELVDKYKTRFSNPKAMYPVLQRYFQSPKEVVEFWLGVE